MIPKFRAWHKTWQEMGKVKRIRFDDDDGNMTKVLFMGKKFGANENIDEIELMQSTGLKDKNGKEIFEGDIITNGIDIVDVRNHKTLGFYIMVNGREVFFGHGTSIKEFEGDIEGFTEITEIIGNIYENPELLEVE